jgi:hypothetical protein
MVNNIKLIILLTIIYVIFTVNILAVGFTGNGGIANVIHSYDTSNNNIEDVSDDNTKDILNNNIEDISDKYIVYRQIYTTEYLRKYFVPKQIMYTLALNKLQETYSDKVIIKHSIRYQKYQPIIDTAIYVGRNINNGYSYYTLSNGTDNDILISFLKAYINAGLTIKYNLKLY